MPRSSRSSTIRASSTPRAPVAALSAVALSMTAVSVAAPIDRPPDPIRPELRSSAAAMVDLEAGWKDPPRLARTRCWWWWLNGNVTPEAITRDLEEMRSKGLGGANIIDAGGAEQRGNRQVNHGPDFASPAWRKLFVHALREADRLELELGFNIQSGWNLGGPGVTPEQAAKRVTWSEAEVEGGGIVRVQLPAPPSRDGFYRDVAVVAFPLRKASATSPTYEIAASSSQTEHPPAQASDGKAATFWVSGSDQPGGGPTPKRPQWLELRFDKPTAADCAVVLGRPDYGPRRCRLEAQGVDDGYVSLSEFSMTARDGKTLKFRRTTSRRFRLVFLDAFDPRSPERPRNVQVAEWSLFDGNRTLTPPPGGSVRIHNFAQKAYHRYPGAFTATEAWHLLDAGPEMPTAAFPGRGEVRDLSANMSEEGRLEWDAPGGRWKVLRFGYTFSGSRVSTHSEGWAGRAIDYLDPDAFDAYSERVLAPIFEEAKPFIGRSLRFLHTDSWELGPVNWTRRLPREFRGRRGYDIVPFLPAIAGYVVESPDISTRFLNDFRRTLADLIADGKYRKFSEYAHRLGLGIHPESGGPHAAPIDALQCLGRNDVPMGEFWARSRTHRVRDLQRLFVKQSASAAHVYGKRIVLAEAFTTIGPHWEKDPRDLKPVFDRVACEGLNLTMLHTLDCSPKEMGVPGQVYFAGTHVNPNVTWWHRAGPFIDYLNRCHFLLQQGLFVADALYFYGENIPAFVRLKRDDPAGVLPGYDYDVVNAEALLTRATVRDGHIVLSDGTTYRLLVLPAHDAIGLAALGRIAELIEAGATVVGRRPRRPYGLGSGADHDAAFQALAERVWGDLDGETSTVRRVGQGRVVWGRTPRQILEGDRVGPDFTYTSQDGEAFLDYIHRATDGAEIYFVANRKDEPVTAETSFRVTGRQPEIWNPLDGSIRDAEAFRRVDGRTIVPLELAPNGSTFILFRRKISAEARGAAERNAPSYSQPLPLRGAWTVRFDPRWGGPASARFEELMSWTERPEDGIRYYSGEATYALTFDRPASVGSSGRRVVLDLGEVRNIAAVRLNGRDLGVVWTPPFRVDVTEALRSQDNRLEIAVVNLWPNRIIGDQRLSPEKRFTRTNVTKFQANSPLLKSGLLGPVTLGEATR